MAGRDEDAIAASVPMDPVSDAAPKVKQVLVLPRSKTVSGEPSVPASIEVDLPAAPRPGTADGADARRGEEGDAGDGGGVLDTTQHKQLQRQEDLSEK